MKNIIFIIFVFNLRRLNNIFHPDKYNIVFFFSGKSITLCCVFQITYKAVDFRSPVQVCGYYRLLN